MLSIPAREFSQVSDSALLFALYRRWGEQGIARCLGAFTFVAWDADERRLTLGRDCLGDRTMFFHQGDGVVTFASDLSLLLSFPFVPRELDETAVANYLVLNHRNPQRTLYRAVERVPSRTLVSIDPRRTTQRHYWSPDFDAPPPYQREEDYIERARELLDQAVATATADTPHVAISTSGGLDSSAIAATAARLGRAQSISCFCIVPPQGMQLDIPSHQYLDERDKVAALARMHPALKVELCVEGQLHPFEEDPTRMFARRPMPVLNPDNIGPFSEATRRAAASGHPVLLNGSKGNVGLTWTGLFSFLALIREGKFAALARELAAVGRQHERGRLRTLASEIARFGVPFVLRRQFYRMRGQDADSVAYFSLLNPAAIDKLDLVKQWRECGFDPHFGRNGWSPARLRARVMFDHNQTGRDGRAMYRALHGVEVRDPLADRRLLEFTLAVPEPMYRRNGVPRSFARAVLADRLPPEILNERRRGFQGATWFRRLDARRQDIAREVERLEASPMASQLIDLPRVKRLLAEWPKDENAAEARYNDYGLAFSRAIHVGRFIRWVEGGNA